VSERRFPAPWTAEVQPNHYVVRDANRQTSIKDEARRIAANIARCEWTKQKQSPKHVARGFFIVLALGTTA